jgi:hypothetical protein
VIPLACACEEPLVRLVFGVEHLRGFGERVVACMRCGTASAVTDVTEPIPDFPERCRIVGLAPLALAPGHLDWLSRWPRRAGDPEAHPITPEETFYLPASVRCANHASLERAEAPARADGAPIATRLRAAGVPPEPAPADLRPNLWHFAATWEALRLHDDTPLEARLERANPIRAPACWFVPLPAQGELVVAIAAMCGDADRARRRAGLTALQVLKRPGAPFEIPEAILAAVADRLRALTSEPAEASYVVAVLSAHDRSAEARLRGLGILG